MMKKGRLSHIGLLFMLLLAGLPLVAQDSLWIHQLDTTGITGQSALKIKSEEVTAGEAIRYAPGIFLRTTSAGGMQFVSAQGLNPQHLQLLWNGIPINSGMLGMNDLSLFSVGYKQEVSYSGMRQDLATGAIAGVVDVRSELLTEDGFRFGIRQSVGSFGQSSTAMSHHGGKQQHAWSSNLIMERAANNFRYNDYTVLPNVEKQQEHGSFKRFNWSPRWQWRARNGGVLQVITEHVYNFRHIPPTLVSPMFRATQEDKATRNLLRYQQQGEKLRHEFSGAYLYNYWYYKDIVLQREDENIEHLGFFRYQGDWRAAEHWQLFYGADVKLTSVSTPNYQDNQQEWGFDAHAGVHWRPVDYMKLTLLSKLSTRSLLPLYAPVSFEWSAWPGKKRKLKLWMRAGTDARFPTLNDRFWQPGGNPELKAERSIGGATGFSVPVLQDNRISWRLKSEAFLTYINDMILWQPTNKFYWVPQNIGNVRAYGILLEQQFAFANREHLFQINQSYGLNKSGSIKPIVPNDKTVGMQLPYFPIHSLKANVDYSWKGLGVGTDVQVYSRRFVTRDQGQQLDAYGLVNIHLSYRKPIHSWSFEGRFSVNNILDQYYEEIVYRPMPIRNYLFTIIINWNHVQN
jgi:iron complex outermembrane receptor protein